MEIVITIIATIFIYNLLGAILYLATKENETVLCFWGLGLVGIITNLITLIYSKVMTAWKNKNFKALLVDTDTNKRYYCDSKDADYFIYEDERFQNLKFDRETVDKYTIKDGWRKSDCHNWGDGGGWQLSARYTPLKICLENGAEKLKKI
jgi:hypothetical protein